MSQTEIAWYDASPMISCRRPARRVRVDSRGTDWGVRHGAAHSLLMIVTVAELGEPMV
jgi:hypothetical protein